MKLYQDYSPLKEEKPVPSGIYCSVCGRPLTHNETQYHFGNESVCNDGECMDQFYENNAETMLVEFAKETGMVTEAIKWFYDIL